MSNKFILNTICLFWVLFICITFFFFSYKISFTFYEESKAIKYSDYILLPVIIILIIILFIYGRKRANRKDLYLSERFVKLDNFRTIIIAVIIGFIIGYFGLLRDSFAGFILFVNSHVGMPKKVFINGIIIDKVEIRRIKSSRFEIYVRDNSGVEYKFDTNGEEIKKYKINEPFQKQMNEGVIGLVYQN